MRIAATDTPPVGGIFAPRTPITKPAGNPTIVKPTPLPAYANSPYPVRSVISVPLPPPAPSSQPPATPPSNTPALEAEVPVEVRRASIAPTTTDQPASSNIGIDLPPRGRVPSPAGAITVGINGGGRGRDSSEGGTTQTLLPGTQAYNDWVANHKKMQDTIALENGIIVAAATIVGTPLAGAAVKFAMGEQTKLEQASSDAITQGAFKSPNLPATAQTSPFGLSNMPPSNATSLGTQVNGVAPTNQGFWEWFKKWIYDLLGITI